VPDDPSVSLIIFVFEENNNHCSILEVIKDLSYQRQSYNETGMPTGLPAGLKILLGLGTLFMLIGIGYFFISTFLAKESILSFDKGIAYFVIGIAVVIFALTIFTVVEMEDLREQLDRIRKR